jgi:hypothetical protein
MSGIGQGALLNVGRELAVDGPTATNRRIETRTHAVFHDIALLQERHDWLGLSFA